MPTTQGPADTELAEAVKTEVRENTTEAVEKGVQQAKEDVADKEKAK